jgi:hypothetical protein
MSGRMDLTLTKRKAPPFGGAFFAHATNPAS